MLSDRHHSNKNNLRRLQEIGFSLLFLLGVCSIFPTRSASATSIIPEAQEYIKNGAYVLQTKNRANHGYNSNISFIPASIIKIVTSLMVLEVFGPEYRFTTPIYIDDQDNLYIKGGGDPFLTSESVRRMAKQLREQKISSFHSLILDGSAFALEGSPPQAKGTDNPYDVDNGALVVNFNTVNFEVDQNNKVISGERQTPLLPIMKDLARVYPHGRHRVNVGILDSDKRHDSAIRYCGELFMAIFKEEGITFTDGYNSGKVPAKASMVLNYSSQITLAEAVQRCLLYSNNYIANQLFLLAGSQQFGAPATWEKARNAANQYLDEKLQLSPDQALMVDGSGLSTQNRISAEAMLVALHRFLPFFKLLPHERGAYLKSGTLTDVYSYAGYFDAPAGKVPFVIILNQQKNNRDKVLQMLHNEVDRLTFHP